MEDKKEKKIEERALKILERGKKIAKILINSGLTIKESNLPDKRVEYFRGDYLVEHMKNQEKKLMEAYKDEAETSGSISILTLGSR